MIFLAIDELEVHTSLLAATERMSASPTASLKPQASSLGEAALADEERLRQFHLQAGDE